MMKTKTPRYFEAVATMMKELENANAVAVARVVRRLMKSIDDGGVLYVFGSGHSAILVEEAFHRAGGLVPVYPILHTFLSPHTAPGISGKLERLPGVGSVLFKKAAPEKRDVLFIASNSGANSASIEMAMEARENKVFTVAFTSLKHSKSAVSRHPSGKKLKDVADVVLDNCVPVGDAAVDVGGARVGAVSTIANSLLYHWIVTEMCARWQRTGTGGKKLPIYLSANLPGGDSHNEKLEKKYRKRIPLL